MTEHMQSQLEACIAYLGERYVFHPRNRVKRRKCPYDDSSASQSELMRGIKAQLAEQIAKMEHQ